MLQEGEQAGRWVRGGVLGGIRFYQRWLSPALYVLFPGLGCRFEPSCSVYAALCVQRHGVWRGGRLAVARVLRCHPFAAGGADPPPERLAEK